MSTPPTLKQKTSTLAWQVSFRLLLALGLSAIIVAVMSAVVVQTFQNKTALREANNTVIFFENAIQDQEQSWEEAAIRYRGRIEFMHLLENPATRSERLTSYLTTQATGATFPDVLITNAQDRILFRFGFGETDTPTLFPHKG